MPTNRTTDTHGQDWLTGLSPTPLDNRTRHLSPGDITRKATDRLRQKRTTAAPPRESVGRQKAADRARRPNNYRQPIGTEDELEFRHLNWANTRAKVTRHLEASGAARTAMDRWTNCGAECVIEWSDEAQRYRLRGSYCHSRHCRPCARSKAMLITKNLQAKLEAEQASKTHRYKFVTHTFRESRDPLIKQLKRAYACLRKLRATSMWKNNVTGGTAMLETKLSRKGSDGKLWNHWHPHFHLIYEGDPIDQARLSKAWHKITGDSFMVDIKEVKSTKDAAFYVSKYVSKGVNDDVWEYADAAAEWIAATRGLRICATFGSWRGFRLTAPPADQLHKDWVAVGILDAVCQRARAGSEADMRLLHLIADSVIYDPSRRQKTSQNTS